MTRRRLSTRLALAGVSATMLAGIAACGSNASSPVATPSLDSQEAALQFSQCMRAHGVNAPDPQINTSGNGGGTEVHIAAPIGGGNPKTNPQMQAAMSACQKYLPQIGGNGSGTPDPARQAQLLQVSQCMRSHGISDFPDPSSDGRISLGGNSGPPPADLNPSNPAFQNAQKACQQFLPGKGAGLQVQDGGGPGPGVVSGSSAG